MALLFKNPLSYSYLMVNRHISELLCVIFLLLQSIISHLNSIFCVLYTAPLNTQQIQQTQCSFGYLWTVLYLLCNSSIRFFYISTKNKKWLFDCCGNLNNVARWSIKLHLPTQHSTFCTVYLLIYYMIPHVLFFGAIWCSFEGTQSFKLCILVFDNSVWQMTKCHLTHEMIWNLFPNKTNFTIRDFTRFPQVSQIICHFPSPSFSLSFRCGFNM